MADVKKAPFLRHLRGAPTTYVQHLRRGRVVHEGIGQAFWFRPLTAVLSEVPVDDREQPLLFHARTRDFQDVTVQATVTYRAADPRLTATRLDFGIDPDTGAWRGAPLDQLGAVLVELAQQQAIDLIASLPLAEALADGVVAVRERLAGGLGADPRLVEIGVAVVGVRVVAVRAEREIERALQTTTREQVQQDADKATYERRAVAVERERAIAENELQSQIELAHREQHLVAQRGANERRRAEEAAAADQVQAEAEAARTRRLAEANAEATRLAGAADGEAEAARLAAYQDVDQTTLLGLAARELASHLPDIGTLAITPDLLTPLLARFSAGVGGPGPTAVGPAPGRHQ